MPISYYLFGVYSPISLSSPWHWFDPWSPKSGKCKGALFSVEARGKVKDVAIFKHYSYGGVECKLYAPSNPRTEAQQANRSKFASAVASWQALPDGSKEAWRKAAVWRRGDQAMSGYNLYIRRFMLDQL